MPTLNQSASHSNNKKSKKTCPFYKWMKDTPFVVDAFNYGKIDNCAGYFLTHFHSDHYGGLSKTWSHGPIYCSQVTANLVQQELKVDAHWLCPLPMDELVDVTQSVQVALMDANHCPGSVLFLFVAGGRRHLHTGDFRANPRMCLHPLIRQPENPPISHLYLDTTYMNPMYAFPAQEECIEAVCEVLKRDVHEVTVKKVVNPLACLDTWIKKVVVGDEQQQARRTTLVLVGTYKIGKEKVFINAAKVLDSKIYVNNNKKQVLLCQENQELNDRLTDQPTKAQVHVVPLQDIRYDKLTAYLDQYKSHFSNIIAIKPTGWTFKSTEEMKQAPLQEIIQPPTTKFTLLSPTHHQSKAKIKIYSVPYSEHSSFRELASFIASLDIGTILPTVNLAKTREMHVILDAWKYEKQAKKIEVVPFMTEDHW
ncbi:DRMBL-domain-containing protein [Backusella circina FSU 941]|nr:DRMBL-domain-containing protein [Backusella circina FSU 941]